MTYLKIISLLTFILGFSAQAKGPCDTCWFDEPNSCPSFCSYQFGRRFTNGTLENTSLTCQSGPFQMEIDLHERVGGNDFFQQEIEATGISLYGPRRTGEEFEGVVITRNYLTRVATGKSISLAIPEIMATVNLLAIDFSFFNTQNQPEVGIHGTLSHEDGSDEPLSCYITFN